MANYRPKSLDELNKLYGKSMAAQNAIKKKGSAIAGSDVKNETDIDALLQQEMAQKEKTPQQKASDELSDALNDFMKTFGETETADSEKPAVHHPLPITKTVKASATPSKPKSDKSAEHPVTKVSANGEPVAKKEKPTLMRNPERSDLLDDYMKIMNDEDDESAFRKALSKKKKKNKKDKHPGSPLADSEETAENEKKSDELFEFSESTEAKDIPEEEPVKEVEPSPEETEEPDVSAEDSEEETETAAPKKKRKNVFLQVILMFVLLAVLLSATGVSLLKVFVGVDSGNAFAENYYVFTADKNYTEAGINEGDLIITENKSIAESEAFAFTDSDNSINYATRGSYINDVLLMAHLDNEVKMINVNQMKGTVIKTFPSLGGIVDIMMNNFIIIITVLVALALIIILVLALAFRTKSNYDIDDSDSETDEDEVSEEDAEEEYSDEDADYDEDEKSEQTDEEDEDPDEDDEFTDFRKDLFSSID